MLIVTGARRTEMAAARLSWISKSNSDQPPVLTLPAEVTKNGRAHAIPLPPLAQKIIGGVVRHHSTDLLFPGATSRKSGKIAAISGWSKLWSALLRISRKYGLNGHLTLHDLRKSARSHWTRIGVATEVSEALLNHKARSRLVAIYDLSDRLDQRIDALTRWSSAIEAAVLAHGLAKREPCAESELLDSLINRRRTSSRQIT